MAEHEWNDGANDIANENYGLEQETEQQPPSEGTESPVEPLPAEEQQEEAQESLEEALAKEFPGEEENSETEPPNKERLEQIAADFKEVFGVDVSEAINNMQGFNTSATDMMEQINQARTSLALQQQRMDLTFAWMGDAFREGKDINDLVEERLAKATEVYATLSPDMQKRIASAGSRGIVSLYKRVAGSSVPSQQQAPNLPSGGRAQITNDNNQNEVPQDLSTLVAMESDSEYWNAMRKVRNGANLNNDIGLKTRR